MKNVGGKKEIKAKKEDIWERGGIPERVPEESKMRGETIRRAK